MTRKINVNILSISLTSGGAEKVISLLLKELKNDFNVTLVLLYNKIHFPIPKGVNVVIFCNKGTNRPFYLKIFDFLAFLIKYNSLVRTNKTDISISFLALPNLMNGIVAMFNKKVKTVISERGFPSDNTSSRLSLWISKIFYPLFYNRCSKLFSNSVYINRDLRNNFGIKIPMKVIYNPIEIPHRTIIPETLNTDEKTLKIITAGSLNKRKNQIMVIRAIEESKLNYRYSILGGGDLKEYLSEEITKANLEEQVLLKGVIKNVDEHLINNQCFVLSSFTEGFPNALLEAMAIGLPSVSTNCLSGPLELLNENKEITINDGEFYIGKYGLLVNNDDHIGLSKALDYFHSNPSEREKFSKLSLKRANEYHLDTIYSKFYQFIKN